MRDNRLLPDNEACVQTGANAYFGLKFLVDSPEVLQWTGSAQSMNAERFGEVIYGVVQRTHASTGAGGR